MIQIFQSNTTKILSPIARNIPQSRISKCRAMATARASLPHEDRTASEPRENTIEPVILSQITQINDAIRLLRLSASDPDHTIKFMPGQWLDTFIPGIPKAGGFTITSVPAQAAPSSHSSPFLELAIQRSKNPPAQWLWRPEGDILGAKLAVRVGGSFTWPPPRIDVSEVDRLVLVAGGVGIKQPVRPREIHFLYATKGNTEMARERILFLPRLMDLIAAADDPNVSLSLFLSNLGPSGRVEHGQFPNRTFSRRMEKSDLIEAISGYSKQSPGLMVDQPKTLCYVCGPPLMTDEFVAFLAGQRGLSPDRVLCEKWW